MKKTMMIIIIAMMMCGMVFAMDQVSVGMSIGYSGYLTCITTVTRETAFARNLIRNKSSVYASGMRTHIDFEYGNPGQVQFRSETGVSSYSDSYVKTESDQFTTDPSTYIFQYLGVKGVVPISDGFEIGGSVGLTTDILTNINQLSMMMGIGLEGILAGNVFLYDGQSIQIRTTLRTDINVFQFNDEKCRFIWGHELGDVRVSAFSAMFGLEIGVAYIFD